MGQAVGGEKSVAFPATVGEVFCGNGEAVSNGRGAEDALCAQLALNQRSAVISIPRLMGIR